MSKENWRRSSTTGYVEVRSEEGKWINPDCGDSCAYCDACLGCLKHLFDSNSKQYAMHTQLMGQTDDEVAAEFHCEKSPDGDHHLILNPEKN